MCVEVMTNIAKTARAACNMSVKADGGVSRCSYCDSSASVLLWVGGCGVAGNWRGAVELRVTSDREDGRECGIEDGVERRI